MNYPTAITYTRTQELAVDLPSLWTRWDISRSKQYSLTGITTRLTTPLDKQHFRTGNIKAYDMPVMGQLVCQ